MREWWRRLVFPFRRRRFDRELDEELQFHADMTRASLEDAGVPADEAQWQARRRVGRPLAIHEQARAPWTVRVLDDLAQDVRYACRVLLRRPAMGLCTIAVLALGIGTATSMFSFFYGVLLRPLPFADADRLVVVWSGRRADDLLVGARVSRHRGWTARARRPRRLHRRQRQPGDRRRALARVGHGSHQQLLRRARRVGGARSHVRSAIRRATPRKRSSAIASGAIALPRARTIVGRSIGVNGVARTIVGVLAAGLRLSHLPFRSG